MILHCKPYMHTIEISHNFIGQIRNDIKMSEYSQSLFKVTDQSN
jgi:hypothetical protein